MKTHSKPGLLKEFETTKSRIFEEPQLKFLDKHVRFSFRHCRTGNTFCITRLSSQEARNFFATMKNFENMTWQQARGLSHEKGFSLEPKDSTTYKELYSECSDYGISTFYHFRVNGRFRIFAGQLNELCCVLLIDREGKVQFHS